MDRISAANATVDRKFRDGDAGTGQRATSFNAAWCNDVQEEIVGLIEAAGFTPASGELQLLKAVVNVVYFVGKQLVIAGDADPNAMFPWQTWTEDTSGRVTVSRDLTQTEFNVVDKTGGSKTQGLSLANLPSFYATIERAVEDGSDGGSSPKRSLNVDGAAGTGSEQTEINTVGNQPIKIPGGGVAHNNLQPYIVRRVWVRTA